MKVLVSNFSHHIHQQLVSHNHLSSTSVSSAVVNNTNTNDTSMINHHHYNRYNHHLHNNNQRRRIEDNDEEEPRLVSALIEDKIDGVVGMTTSNNEEKLDDNKETTIDIEMSKMMMIAVQSTNLKSRSSTHPDISTEKTVATRAAESVQCLEVAEKLADIEKKSPWEILCQIINCKFAFKKQYNGRKYNWIQLAGHAGRFKPGDREGYILKLMNELEKQCLENLKSDALREFVPLIDQVIVDAEDRKHYTEMQDLLYGFEYPSIMDIKIGVRTFLENDSENDEKETKPRRDLYDRLVELAPDEPTAEEHQLKAITKRRYMSWRERSTCSATLGFRIEAIKKNQVQEKEFYSVKTKKEVQYHFKNYTDNKKHIIRMYLNRLIGLRESLHKSDFFYSHEMIGSSLLFVHDDQKANIWMIDFGKTRPLPEGVRLTHNEHWIEGNHEDGYLIGIQSLIDIFQELLVSS